jgi:hypothetical protein
VFLAYTLRTWTIASTTVYEWDGNFVVILPIPRCYKESSIISGTGAVIWSKSNVGPTGHYHSRSSPFRAYVPYVPRPFLNESWKSCSVRLFSTACDSASITSIVSKWRPFSFIFSRGKQRNVGWVGDHSHVVFSKKIPC